MNILLAITGSISAYKSIDLTRALVNNGHSVKVVLTKGALNFVNPNVFSYLGIEATFESLDDFKNKGVLHVELARWAEIFVIAPLSANTLSRLVRAEASDLLSSIFLAFNSNRPILVFPAMNSAMLEHPFVKENFESLKKLSTLPNIQVFETSSGKLACNDEGKGKLLPIEEIQELIESYPLVKNENVNKKIVITTGATISPLDPVRFLTNSSSGITGFYLAKFFLAQNYCVTLIAGKNATTKIDLLKNHPNIKISRVSTVDQMYASVHAEIENADLFISSAAVSDIEFPVCNEKIKKDKIGTSIEIVPAKDILKSVLDKKLAKLKVVGFAAETNLSQLVLNKKMESKPVDLLIGTLVNNGHRNSLVQGFDNHFADYKLMDKSGIIFEGNLLKENLGREILNRVQI